MRWGPETKADVAAGPAELRLRSPPFFTTTGPGPGPAIVYRIVTQGVGTSPHAWGRHLRPADLAEKVPKVLEKA